MNASAPLAPATCLALALTLSALNPTMAQAGNDWPQWRGPSRTDVSDETGLLKEWPAGGPKLLWKASGLGNGYATIVTSGDRIFTMGDLEGASHLLGLERASGKRLWATKVGQAGAPGWGGFEGSRCTPVTDGESVFGVGQYGEFICVDAATGAERWRKHLEKDFGGKRPEWGYAESPLLDGAHVVVTPGGAKGAVVALDKKSGQIVWQSKDFKDAAHYSSLIAVEIGGVRQYLQLTEQSVAGIAANDGRLLWRAARKGATAVIPSPIYHDGYVYVTSGYGVGCNLFKITAAGGAFSAEQVYANKVMANHHGGVVQVGDYVYGHSDGKGWTCQKLSTGEAVWQEKGRLGKGSLTCVDGQLYLRAEDGKGAVALIEATPKGYQEKGRFDQPSRTEKNSWAHPVVSDGKLWIRDQDTLFCYDVRG